MVKRAAIQYALIYILLVMVGCLLFILNQDLIYVLIIGIAIFYVVAIERTVEKKCFCWIMALLGLLLLSSITSHGSLEVSAILGVIIRFVFCYIVYKIDEDAFIGRLVRMITILAAISLVCYVVSFINPNLLISFSLKGNLANGTRIGYYSWIYSYLLFEKFRNCGIYTEPGMYQIVLNVGLYLLLFHKDALNYKNNKNYLISIVIQVIAIITNMSAAGYMAAISLGIIAFISKRPSKNRFFASILVLGFVLLVYMRYYDFFNLVLFSKIVNSSGQLDLSVSTGNSRLWSMYADMQVAMRYPLGAGYIIYDDIWKTFINGAVPDIASCVGFTKIIAVLGFPASILMTVTFLSQIFRIDKGIGAKVALLAIFIITSFSQPAYYYTVYIVVFFALSDQAGKQKNLEVYL